MDFLQAGQREGVVRSGLDISACRHDTVHTQHTAQMSGERAEVRCQPCSSAAEAVSARSAVSLLTVYGVAAQREEVDGQGGREHILEADLQQAGHGRKGQKQAAARA
jgi:hypothetical protein